MPIPEGVRIEQKDGNLELVRDNDKLAALHGLTRALAANAMTGVSTGFDTRAGHRRNRLSRGCEGQGSDILARLFTSDRVHPSAEEWI